MPFNVTTKDGITIRNIPDDIEPDSQEVRQRVADARAQRDTEDQEGLNIGQIAGGAANILASGAVEAGREVVEGISGIGGLIAGRDLEPSIESAQALAGQIPELPLGENAQALIADLSRRFQAAPERVQEIVQAIGTLGPTVGETVFQATGSPLAATVAGAIPGALEAATGLKAPGALARAIPDVPTIDRPQPVGVELPSGGQGVDIPPEGFPPVGAPGDLPTLAEGVPVPVPVAAPAPAPVPLLEGLAEGIFNFQTPEKIRIGQLIEAGSTDIDTAKFKIEQGRVKTDKKAIEAVKQGFDEGVLAVVKASPKPDKSAFKDMVNIMEKAKANVKFGLKNRPSDVPGKLLSNQLDFIKGQNVIASRQVNKEARKIKGKAVPFEAAQETFFRELDNLGVTFDDKGIPNFELSEIQGLPPAQNIITKIVKRMDRPGVPDGFEIHKIKQFLDTQIKFGKSQEGLADEGLRIARQLRFDFSESLNETFPAYAKVNEKFSITKDTLDNFEDVAGTKIEVGDPGFNKFAGTLLRRLSSNAISRIPLENSIDEIVDVAKQLGVTFKGDIYTQAVFSTELDDVFGEVARKSFGGEIGTQLRRGAQAIRSPEQLAIEGVTAIVEKARGTDQKGAFKAIKALLGE